METTSLRSPVLPPQPSLGTSRCRKTVIQYRRRGSSTMVFAAKRDGYSDGRLVDENMVVLRKRIHEMKMVERNEEPPAEWTDWEKRYYANYESDVCEAMGLLQAQLMNTRPSLALGMVALVTLSVPTSMIIMAFHLMEIAKGILSGIYPI